jgi:hypothetical protein
VRWASSSPMTGDAQIPAAPEDTLVPVARAKLLAQLAGASRIVRLASPFLGAQVAQEIAGHASSGKATELRLLTAVTERSVAARALSARGLLILLDAGWQVRSIPNLHAKVALVDRTWGLVGSGNLTGAGLGGPAGEGNIELGVTLSPQQHDEAIRIVDEWWDGAASGIVTAEQLERVFLPIERRAGGHPMGRWIGVALPPPADDRIARRVIAPGAGLWVKAMYQGAPKEGEWWIDLPWIHDRHRVQADGSLTWRPGYRVGDRVVLYLIEPRSCVAIYQVVGLPEDGREQVRVTYPDDADRYGWITPVEMVAVVPVADGLPLGLLGKTAQGLQNGRIHLSDRQAYTRFERELARRVGL